MMTTAVFVNALIPFPLVVVSCLSLFFFCLREKARERGVCVREMWQINAPNAKTRGPSVWSVGLTRLLSSVAVAASSAALGTTFPAATLSCLVLACSAAWALSRSHLGAGALWGAAREWWPAIAVHALAVVVHVAALTSALRMCGIVRTVLVLETLDIALSAVVSRLALSLSPSPSRAATVGVASSVCGIGVLFLLDTGVSGSGILALLITALVTLAKSKVLPKLPRDARPFPLAAGACLLLPFGAAQLVLEAGVARLFDVRVIFAVAVASVSRIAEVNGPASERWRTGGQYALTAVLAFSGAVVLELVSGAPNPAGFATHAAAMLCIFGAASLAPMHGSDSAALPLTAGHPVSSSSSQSAGSLFRSGFRQVLERKKSRRLFLYLLLNLTFMTVEVSYGLWTNSLGLISDGCHMLFDCIALAIGLAAAVVAKWDPNTSFSYGYGRVQVLSGFANGVFLVLIALMVFAESLHRFWDEADMKTERLLLVSVAGLAVNITGVLAFHQSHAHHGDTSDDDERKRAPRDARATAATYLGHLKTRKRRHHKSGAGAGGGGQHKDENLHGIFLHVLADTLGSVGVIVSSMLVEWYGLRIADPICSLVISLLIFSSVIPLLKESGSILLQANPLSGAKVEAISRAITMATGGRCIEAHFWAHTSAQIIGTLAVELPSDANEQRALAAIQGILREHDITSSCVECLSADQPTASRPPSPPLSSIYQSSFPSTPPRLLQQQLAMSPFHLRS
jgi:zinc transporter 5/7